MVKFPADSTHPLAQAMVRHAEQSKVTFDPADNYQFSDPVFRISNLYSIRTCEGKVIPFRPRPRQLQVLDVLYRQKLKRVCILKARQLGFSTLLGIVCLDQPCWSVGRQVLLVDKTQEDAGRSSRTSSPSPTTRFMPS